MTAMLATPGAGDPVPAATPLRRNRRFQVFWIAGALSMLGMETGFVAYPMVVLALTESAARAGLFGTVMMLAIAAGALPAGAAVDRFDERTVLLLADGARLLAVASIAVAVATQRLGLGHVVLVAAVVGTAHPFAGAARLLILRTVVAPEQLTQALTYEHARLGLTQMSGPPLGGFLYAVAAALPFVANVLSMALSWLCTFGLRVALRALPSTTAGPAERDTGVRQVFAGVAALWRTRTMRGAVLFMIALNIASAPVPLVTIVALSRQHVPSGTIGLAVSGIAMGALAGTVLIKPLSRLLRPGVLLLMVGAVEVPVLSILALQLGPYGVMAVLFVSMLPVPALRVAVDILIYRRASAETRGRTIAAVIAVLCVGSTAGIGIAGLALEYLGVAGALVVLLGMLAGAVGGLAFDGEFRSMPWPAEPGGAVGS